MSLWLHWRTLELRKVHFNALVVFTTSLLTLFKLHALCLSARFLCLQLWLLFSNFIAVNFTTVVTINAVIIHDIDIYYFNCESSICKVIQSNEHIQGPDMSLIAPFWESKMKTLIILYFVLLVAHRCHTERNLQLHF